MIDINEILQKKEERLPYYSALHTEMDKAEKYYNLGFQISVLNVPVGVDQVIPSTARAVVDHATAHVAANWIIVKAEPKSRGKGAREQADKIERVGQAFFYEVNMAGESLPIHGAIKSAHVFGMYVIRLLWNEEVWEEYGGERFPFDVAVLDPRTILPEPSRLREPRDVIEFCQRQRGDLASHYPSWSKADSGTPTDFVEWLSYWDKKQYLYAIDGEVVGEGENPYGFVPYTIGTSGLGETMEGIPPEKRIRSILWPIMDDLDMEARLLTDIGVIVRWGAFNLPTAKSTDPSVKGITFEMAPGRMNLVPDSFKLEEMVQFNPQLLNVLQINQGKIEAATYSGILTGGGQASSGYERSVAMRTAEQKFAYLLQQLNYSMTWLFRSALKIIDTHPDKPSLSISGMAKGKRGTPSYIQESISREDIKGYYSGITCQIEQADPMANQAKAMLGSNLHTGGKISLKTFLEVYAGIEDYTSELAQITAEKILSSPEIQQLIIQSIIQEAGFAEYVQQEAQGVGETLGVPGAGQGPPGGQPPVQGQAPVFSEAEAMFGPGAPTPEQGRLQEAGVWPARAPGPRFEKMGGG